MGEEAVTCVGIEVVEDQEGAWIELEMSDGSTLLVLANGVADEERVVTWETLIAMLRGAVRVVMEA